MRPSLARRGGKPGHPKGSRTAVKPKLYLSNAGARQSPVWRPVAPMLGHRFKNLRREVQSRKGTISPVAARGLLNVGRRVGLRVRLWKRIPRLNVTADSNSLPLQVRRGLYETIFRRRDMREFRPDSIPDEVLARVLVAAHHAASVGFTQPWEFIIVRDLERRREVKRVFEEERLRNAAQFTGKRREKFLSLKLEGIIESPLNLIVTCQPERCRPGVLCKTPIHHS